MAIDRSSIRKDILERPCEKCDEPLAFDKDFVLTFFRGRFIVLHEECADFIDTAKKGPRNSRSRNDKGLE